MNTPSSSSPPVASARRRLLPLIARLLLGLTFLASGLFGLLKAPPPPTSPPFPDGLVALFNGLVKSGYLFQLLKVTETVVGALLLANRFVPLALTILAPITVNIVAVHAVLAPSGLPLAAVVLLLHVYLAWVHREAYRPMLAARQDGAS